MHPVHSVGIVGEFSCFVRCDLATALACIRVSSEGSDAAVGWGGSPGSCWSDVKTVLVVSSISEVVARAKRAQHRQQPTAREDARSF